MNENSIINTAKVRWLKSQEIFQILKEPPRGLIVDKIPTKPQNGDIFILDSKIIKRKWKQDGWTYMPRKQGIGFREDNENLRIGGENAITCYYSYIINGLLEGEEKMVVMNRRIYKLFPDGQYFFVHYLKDSSGVSNNSIKENSLLVQNSNNSTSIQTTQQQIQSSNSVETDYQDTQKKSQNHKTNNIMEFEAIQQQQLLQNNYILKEEILQHKQDLIQRHHSNNNNILNSTTVSAASDLESASKDYQYPLNDYTQFNQEESSYYSNSSPVCSTNQIVNLKFQDKQERNHLSSNNSNKSQFNLQNFQNQQNLPQKSQFIEGQINHFSIMEEESDLIVQNQFECKQNGQNLQQQNKNLKIHQENISGINESKNNSNNCEFFNNLSLDGDYDLKIELNGEDGFSTNDQNQINANFIQQQIQSTQNSNFNDLEDWNDDQFANINNQQQQYKGNYGSFDAITKQNQNNRSHEFQQIDLERNFDDMIYNGDENFRNITNNIQHNLYDENEYIDRNDHLQNNNQSLFAQRNIYESQKQNRQCPDNSMNHQNLDQSNKQFQINQQTQVFQKHNQSNQQLNPSNKINQNQTQQLQQNQKDNSDRNISDTQLLNYLNIDTTKVQFNTSPSYSKLQERIIELEERLQKLEFGKGRQQAEQIYIEGSSMAYPQNQIEDNNLTIHNNSQNEQKQKFKKQNLFSSNQNQEFYNQNEHQIQSNSQKQTQMNNSQKILKYQQQQNSFYNNNNHQENQSQQTTEYIQHNQNINQNIQTAVQNKLKQQDIYGQSNFPAYNQTNLEAFNQNQSNNQNQRNNQGFNQNNQNGNISQINNSANYNSNNFNQNSDIQNNHNENHLNKHLNCDQNNISGYNQNQIQEEGHKQTVNNQKKNQQNQNLSSSNGNLTVPIKVTEYSPEWDYTKGGSKMVLCFLPALSNLSEYQMSQFQIGFGDKKVPAYCIQPGVLKCFVPPHDKGIVKLQIYLENQRIDCIDDKPSYFEFRNQEKKKKKQTSKKVIFNQDDEFYRNEFKVRIIDKLNSIQDFISQSSSTKSNQTGFSNHAAQIDNSQLDSNSSEKQKDLEVILESLRDSLDNLNNQNFNTLLTNILNIAEGNLKKNQIKKWIDQVDDNGYGIIHYIVILGFDTSINVLKEFDCNLNLMSRNKITPLQLAFALNQEKIVEILIKSGALGENLNQQLQGGQIKGDIQQISSLLNLGTIYQSRNILDMLVREVTLHDSINNSSLNDHISWNDQDEQEDNYLDIKDLCEPSNENDLIKNLNAISHQLQDLNKKKRRRIQKKNNVNNQEGEYFSLTELEKSQSYLGEDEDEYDEDDYDDEEDEEEDDDDDDEDDYSKVFKPLEQNKLQSQDNLDKNNKKHKYLRNYSEMNKGFKDKQRDITEFDEKDEQLYMSQNYQCRIKTIQKNVRGWLLRRQYLDIKYATRVLQNWILIYLQKTSDKGQLKSISNQSAKI